MSRAEIWDNKLFISTDDSADLIIIDDVAELVNLRNKIQELLEQLGLEAV